MQRPEHEGDPMRKTWLVAVAAALAFSVVPVSAAEPPGRLEQQEAGQIMLLTRFTDGEQGWPGLGRRAWLCSAATNGAIAWVFDVFESTWGGMFVIDQVDDDTGDANIQVYFYEDMGDCGGQADPITSGQYASDQPGEVGFVPDRTSKAVVFMPTGANATFRYRGFSPPRIRLGQDDLDISVTQGAVVRWVNTTDDFAYVRAVDGSFDSSPTQGTGIPVGGVWERAFTQTGTIDYETPVGEGTITVVSNLDDL
jgi:hypothetical protein